MVNPQLRDGYQSFTIADEAASDYEYVAQMAW